MSSMSCAATAEVGVRIAASGDGLRSRLKASASVADLLKGSGRLDERPTRFEVNFTSADFFFTRTLPVHFAPPDR